MAAEIHNPEKQRQSAAPMAVGAMILLLFLSLLYVFSIGPVVWLYDRQYLSKSSEPALEVVYSPLQYAADSSPAVERAIQLYISLWQGTPVPVATPATATAPVASPYAIPAPSAVPPATY